MSAAPGRKDDDDANVVAVSVVVDTARKMRNRRKNGNDMIVDGSVSTCAAGRITLLDLPDPVCTAPTACVDLIFLFELSMCVGSVCVRRDSTHDRWMQFVLITKTISFPAFYSLEAEYLV